MSYYYSTNETSWEARKKIECLSKCKAYRKHVEFYRKPLKKQKQTPKLQNCIKTYEYEGPGPLCQIAYFLVANSQGFRWSTAAEFRPTAAEFRSTAAEFRFKTTCRVQMGLTHHRSDAQKKYMLVLVSRTQTQLIRQISTRRKRWRQREVPRPPKRPAFETDFRKKNENQNSNKSKIRKTLKIYKFESSTKKKNKKKYV